MATSNPLVAQGSLNRVQASVSIPNNTSLNVTAPFLGTEGIHMAVEGTASQMLDTMTGLVISPEVYMHGRVTIQLIKSQALADAWKTQMELDARIGTITIRPDLSPGGGLSPYVFQNCAITSVRELNFTGSDPGWVVEVRGFYSVNSVLWAG